MSKFNETFDGIKADDELKEKVRARINESEQALNAPTVVVKKPLKPWKTLLIAVSAVFAFVMIFPAAAAIGNAVQNPQYDFSKARQVKSETQLKGLLNVSAYYPRGGSMLSCASSHPYFGDGIAMENDSLPSPAAPGAESPASSAANQNSSTNIQVQGMDEGDIIKNDGNYIYRLSRNGFDVTETDRGSLSRVCSVPFTNFSPIEMYVQGDKLILIGGGYKTPVPAVGAEDLRGGKFSSYFSYHTLIEIRIYDISEITDPKLERYFEIEGSYYTSRIREENGILYFVANYYGYSRYDSDGNRPRFRNGENEDPDLLPLEDIYYFKNSPANAYLIVGTIDLNNPGQDAEIKTYLSSAYIVYVSGENLYTVTSQWFYDAFDGGRTEQRTYIAKFPLESLMFAGSGRIKGSPKDRYCLDEYDGYLRVAASEWGAFRSLTSNIYVFDREMKKAAEILNISPGEAVDSAAFSGPKGYVSTSVHFTDPLFIIDFTDPYHPTVNEGLKEDGINQYLKAIEGTDYVLGFGTDSDGSGMQTGLKIQLYDMSGAEAKSVAKLTIGGDWCYAEVLQNPKALLYLYDTETKTGLVGFAAESAGYTEISDPSYPYGLYPAYTIFSQGFYLYRFDAAAGTLEEAGFLTNFSASPLYQSRYNYRYSDYYETQSQQLARYGAYISRAVVINGYLYTVADSVIAGYDLETLQQLGAG